MSFKIGILTLLLSVSSVNSEESDNKIEKLKSIIIYSIDESKKGHGIDLKENSKNILSECDLYKIIKEKFVLETKENLNNPNYNNPYDVYLILVKSLYGDSIPRTNKFSLIRAELSKSDCSVVSLKLNINVRSY